MAKRALSFAAGFLKLAWHLRMDGHYAAHTLLFGRIYSLRCVCGETFWSRSDYRSPGSPQSKGRTL